MTFGRRIYTPPPPAPLRPLERAPNYASAAGMSAAIIKPEPAKPGKTAPTKEEREWMDAIVRYGCIACVLDGVLPRPTAVHHIISANRRMGHLFTLPLCDPGHHQGGQPLGLISRHPWKAQFEARYGTEDELLATLQHEIAHGKK